jgi:hypothetical protein
VGKLSSLLHLLSTGYIVYHREIAENELCCERERARE